MKRVERQNIFETNSSSNHALLIRKNSDLFYDDFDLGDDGFVHTEFGEFGWGIETIYDQPEKLSYAVTMVAETEKFLTEAEFYATDGMKAIDTLFREKIPGCQGVIVDKAHFAVKSYKDWKGVEHKYMTHSGYIDHQSTEGYHSLQDFLDDWGISLERFIFDENVGLLIDNDNH